ncbi:hypothetical protein [Paraburkholderia sp. DGU8]|uniref:hypothetical protein n=1 Tax=Paraburkholderia sp. DGU8 TaxID=3161997 RepID=UPI003467C3DB
MSPVERPDSRLKSMLPQWLIPLGRWNVRSESPYGQGTIRISGQALSSLSQETAAYQLTLTPDQAQELVSGLNLALVELELQRTADLARGAEGAG